MSAENSYRNAENSANALEITTERAEQYGNTNASNTANNITSNAGLTASCNTANISTSNSYATNGTDTNNLAMQAMQAYDAGLSRATQKANAEYATATSITSGIASTVQGGFSGGVGGAISGFIGGVANGINAAFGVQCSNSITESGISYAQQKVNSAQNTNTHLNSNNNSVASITKDNINYMTRSQASNNASLTKTNAANDGELTRRNGQTNAKTTRDNAYNDRGSTFNALNAALYSGQLTAPPIYGSNTGNSYDTTAPQYLQTRIVRQNDNAIAVAGDAMLRYGYMYNRYYAFSNFNIMKHYTYWQIDNLIMRGNIINAAREAIKDVLQSGVTVWRDPEKIGKVSIYDNGI